MGKDRFYQLGCYHITGSLVTEGESCTGAVLADESLSAVLVQSSQGAEPGQFV